MKKYKILYLLIIFVYTFLFFSIRADEVIDYTELEDKLLQNMKPENLPQTFEFKRYSSLSFNSKNYLNSSYLDDNSVPIFQLNFEFSSEKSEVFYNSVLNFDKDLSLVGEYKKQSLNFSKSCSKYNAGLMTEIDFFSAIYNSPVVQQTIYDPISSKTIFENCFNYDPNAPLFYDLLVFLSNKVTFDAVDFKYNPFYEVLKVEFWNITMYEKPWQYYMDEVNILFDMDFVSKTPNQLLYEISVLTKYCSFDSNSIKSLFWVTMPDLMYFRKPFSFRESAWYLIHLKTLQLLIHPNTSFVIKEFIVNNMHEILSVFLKDTYSFIGIRHSYWELDETEGSYLLDFLINRSYIKDLNNFTNLENLDNFKNMRYQFHWYKYPWIYWLDSHHPYRLSAFFATIDKTNFTPLFNSFSIYDYYLNFFINDNSFFYLFENEINKMSIENVFEESSNKFKEDYKEEISVLQNFKKNYPKLYWTITFLLWFNVALFFPSPSQ